MNMGFDVSSFKQTLESWVNFETPTGDEKRLTAFSSLVLRALENDGAEIQSYHLSGGPLLHAVFGKGEKRCVLMGHMDTVFPLGEAERYDEENGKLYGAGVLDMKSGLLMLTYAFNHISKILPAGWKIEALINSDEERGSVDSREKISEILAGAHLVFSFEGNRENCLTVSRKGILTFEIVSKGIAAHTSGGADKHKNAIYHLVKAVNSVYDLDLPKGISLNIGVIEGGKATNIVADRAKIKGEIRAETLEDIFMFEKEIEKISREHALGYARLTLRPPMPPNEKTMHLFRIVSQIDPNLRPRAAGGGGDAAFAYLAGAYVLDGLGAEGANAHTRREYVKEESVLKRWNLSLKAIERCMEEIGREVKK